MKKTVALSILIFVFASSFSQTFTHADTLRGSYNQYRSWWDVLKYDLHVKFNIEDSTINGYNIIQFKKLKPGRIMQIDLQDPMVIDSIRYVNESHAASILQAKYKKDGDAYFVDVPDAKIQNLKLLSLSYLTVYYHGKPKVAIKPPWDGGLIWTKDENNNPWVTIACQGLGASVWYPCKDHQSDEPDSAEMHITCPDTLVCVGNGRLRGKQINKDGTATYDWAVVNPINNYCIIPYIGKYVNFSEVYKGEKGNLDMNYWVLDYNLDKAKVHFVDARRMMKAFEYWFGPYPFYKDGYKLVDAPHLGMEHQSATAYGNKYLNGYLGKDLSGSGWGLKWDYIIVHESGHEWFGNNITTKDIADMWVHEGFTMYSETLFIEYYYGKDAALAYEKGIRASIKNKYPITGSYNVNDDPSNRGSDMYSKGSNMLHNIRQVINNDDKFRKILRGLNQIFYHKTVTAKQVEDYISKQAGIDFSKVFEQYLRTINIPVLEYKINTGNLSYRWTNCVKGFNMPVKIMMSNRQYQFIYPKEKFTQIKFKMDDLKVDDNFYIYTSNVS